VNAFARALGVVGVVLTGLLALFFFAMAVGGAEFARGFGTIILGSTATGSGRIALAALALVLIGAMLVLLLRAFGFGGARIVEFESDAGRMTIDVSALEECLRRTALEDPDVGEASASIRMPRGGVSRPIACDLDVALYERADIPGKGGELASQIRRRFLQILPVEYDPVVNLHVRISAPKYTSAATAALTPATGMLAVGRPEDAQPEKLPDVPEFTGERRYAVQDDDEST
jgi:hypothetical protein